MDLSYDKEAFLLSRIAGALGEDGNGFLRDYWIKSGRLQYAQILLGSDFSFADDEVQYLLITEDLCERLIRVLDPFLAACCGEGNGGGDTDPSTAEASSLLIDALQKLKNVDLRFGWRKMCETFSETVPEIESLVSRLIAMHRSGKTVFFRTNTCAADFLKANQIDFRTQRDKFFLCRSGSVG